MNNYTENINMSLTEEIKFEPEVEHILNVWFRATRETTYIHMREENHINERHVLVAYNILDYKSNNWI